MQTAAAALVAALEQIDEPLESFDYERCGSYRETVRQAAAASLARLVSAHPAVHRRVAGPLHRASLPAAARKHKLNASTRWASAVALERMGPPQRGRFDEALGHFLAAH